MNTYQIILLISSIFLFTTCLDEIDLETPSDTPKLVVGGTITTHPGPYSIFLAESADFVSGPAGTPDIVSGATVIIRDNQGHEEILTEFLNGEYRTANTGIQGVVGNTYQIEIQWNGKTYMSQPETILPVVSAESLETEVRDIEELNEAGNFVNATKIDVKVNTFFPTSDNGSYLRWTSFGTYEYAEIGSQGNLNPDICYVTEDVDFDNVAVASSNEVNGDFLEKQLVLTRNVDYRFTDNYCFSVVQHSITEAAYEFWSAVQEEFERTGNIFETPPSKIRGNVYNVNDDREEVLGFFSASAVDTIKILINGPEAGNPSPQCVPFPPGPPSCFNCLSLSNSTLTKPECFE